jgi:hypothetical protein
MKIVLLFFIIGLVMSNLFYLWGYHEGNKHAACWHSDLESFQLQEIPAPETDPFPKGPDTENGDPL